MRWLLLGSGPHSGNQMKICQRTKWKYYLNTWADQGKENYFKN